MTNWELSNYEHVIVTHPAKEPAHYGAFTVMRRIGYYVVMKRVWLEYPMANNVRFIWSNSFGGGAAVRLRWDKADLALNLHQRYWLLNDQIRAMYGLPPEV